MNPNNMPVMWSIAGSDSSGGAGIQADIKTATALGVHAATVITAITAQNSLKISSVEATSSVSFASQLESLQADMPPRVIKIGLLASVKQVTVLASTLQKMLCKPFVIFDPVQMASTGCLMAEEGVIEATKHWLLPLVDLLTPNLSELGHLSDLPVRDLVQQKSAVKALLALGCKAILLKGGHGKGEHASDQYYTSGASNNPLFTLSSPRLDIYHTHGTGCTLSSAIAAAVSKGYMIEDALVVAKAYLNQGLRLSYAVGQGRGTLGHIGWPMLEADFPHIDNSGAPNLQVSRLNDHSFASVDRTQLGLYPVVPDVCWIERLLKLGVKTIQLRAKDLPIDQAEQQVIQAIALGRKYQAQVFINDYWQLAIKHQAYGVHLGQEDIQLADLTAISRAGLRLGISTHGYCELLCAKQLSPSYIALGHIFATQTKDMPSTPQGLTNLSYYQRLSGNTPTVAIGGISLQRVDAVKQTGVDGVAMVSAITAAENWQKVTQTLLDKLLPKRPQAEQHHKAEALL